MSFRHLQKILAHATLVLCAVSAPAFAHDDATLATMKSPNGGQLKVAGPWHLELVQKATGGDNVLVVYVTDHDGKGVATKGFTGTATILAGKDKQTVNFQPDGENRLKASARYDATAKPKFVVAVSGGGKSEQARFAPAP